MPLQKLIMICLLCALAGTAQAQCYQSFLNDGKAYAGKGLWDKAIAAYNDAKQCQSDKPANGDAVLNGLINEAKKQKQAAIDRKKQADAERRAREQADAQQREQERKQQEAAQREDDNAWAIAQSAQNAAACRTYREKYKNGRHLQDALQCEKDYSDDDKDGVLNKNDKCPKVPGTAANNGCPPDNNSIPSTTIPLPAMISVAGGEFDMGSNDGDSDEKPVHKVRVKSFYLSRYETTNAEFCAFLNEKGNQSEGGAEWIDLGGSFGSEKCRILRNGERFSVESGYERHPVIFVSWYGAVAYCKWLSEKTGQAWRLPSEAEWEYAARGGETGTKDGFIYAGSNDIDAVAWYTNNTKDTGTRQVATKKPNQLGLYDMSGNVWEWCADTWHDTYEGAPADGSAWTAGGEQNRAVLRGGSWFNVVYDCRAANRSWLLRDVRYDGIGFRVARGGGAN